ncbi:uncharacterized protein LOC132556662 [Ylistrum balloti]|uniref:uncharacterized protein LOC132556662 n=1 Tax=Ylistrum balloti TaxID=509963 RepID=UPI002905CD76|nr:uncharacterized protein LOC132556662 [Ylistrum balloti]
MAVSHRMQIIYRKLCFALCLCGFVTDLVGFLLPNWVNYIIGGYRHYYGLFSTCIVRSEQQACGTMDPGDMNETFMASQAFGILGLITYFSCVVCCCIVFCWPRPWKRPLLYAASALALVTAVFTMLTLVLFYTSYPRHGSRLDFGYYIAVAGCVLSPFIAFFAFYIAKITSFPPEKSTPIGGQELCVIDLDSVSVTSSRSLGYDNLSLDMPIILREFTSDNFLQVPPEFQKYTREETKAGPSFFFNHRPSDEVIQKVEIRNAQNRKQQSPSSSKKGSGMPSQIQPSPSCSKKGLKMQGQTPPSPSCSQKGLEIQRPVQPSPSCSQKGLKLVQPSPFGSRNELNRYDSMDELNLFDSQFRLGEENQMLSNSCGSRYGSQLTVTHLGTEVDTSRCTTPVENVEIATSSV